MKDIDNESIDLIIADLPYGITANKWDVIIPADKLWEQYRRIIKDHGCIALFGQEPFNSYMRINNKKMYRYDWVWIKPQPVNFLNAHRMPMRTHELISIFYKHLPTYNPQMRTGFKKYIRKASATKSKNYRLNPNYVNNKKTITDKRYPIDVVEFSKDNANRLHPTQKPVALLEYLIKTYTNEGEVVLDNVMGSGSTGIAALKNNRDFIGMELDREYFNIAQDRINNYRTEMENKTERDAD